MILFIAFASIFLVRCAPSPPPKLEPIPITLTYEMPIIKALENYPELQEKEGISISVAPYSFSKKRYFNRKCEWEPRVLDLILGNKAENRE